MRGPYREGAGEEYPERLYVEFLATDRGNYDGCE